MRCGCSEPGEKNEFIDPSSRGARPMDYSRSVEFHFMVCVLYQSFALHYFRRDSLRLPWNALRAAYDLRRSNLMRHVSILFPSVGETNEKEIRAEIKLYDRRLVTQLIRSL